MKRILQFAFATVLAGSIYLTYELKRTPDIPALLPPTQQTPVSVKYFGTSTLLFDDGETQIMIDGFFSRPGLSTLAFESFSPDLELLKKVVNAESLDRLAAVIPVHSHHDHAMDTAPLAELTGALVIGSESTANLARGWGLEESQIEIVGDQRFLNFGEFEVELIKSNHVPMPDFLSARIGLGDTIDSPVSQPARIGDYKEGGSYTILIRHPQHTFLVQGSAGFVRGRLAGREVETALIGVAGLSAQSNEYVGEYVKEIVLNTGAQRVIPIHWDSFTRPASELGLPTIIDDIPETLQHLQTLLDPHGIELSLLPVISYQSGD